MVELLDLEARGRGDTESRQDAAVPCAPGAPRILDAASQTPRDNPSVAAVCRHTHPACSLPYLATAVDGSRRRVPVESIQVPRNVPKAWATVGSAVCGGTAGGARRCSASDRLSWSGLRRTSVRGRSLPCRRPLLCRAQFVPGLHPFSAVGCGFALPVFPNEPHVRRERSRTAPKGPSAMAQRSSGLAMR